MKNDFLFHVLFKLWKDFLVTSYLNRTNDSFTDSEKSLKNLIGKILQIFGRYSYAKSVSATSMDDAINKLLNKCDHELKILSQIDPEQRILLLDTNYLEPFARLLMSTKTLLSLYKMEQVNTQGAIQISQSLLLDNISEITEHAKSLRKQNSDFEPALETLGNITIFVEHLEEFAAFAKNAKPGDWGKKHRGLWFHVEDYKSNATKSAVENAFECLKENISQYIKIYEISIKKDESHLFFAAHTIKGVDHCMEGRIREVYEWANKRGYFENSNFTPSESFIATWQGTIQIINTDIINNPNTDIPTLVVKHSKIINQVFLSQFAQDYLDYTNGNISAADLISIVKARGLAVSEKNQQVMLEEFLAYFMTEILGINDVAATQISIHSSSTTLTPSTKIFSAIKKTTPILLPQQTLAATNIFASVIAAALLNSSMSKEDKVVDIILELIRWKDELHPIDWISGEDLVTVNELTEPLYHFAIRNGDPKLIARVASLPRSRNVVINPQTQQSTLHILATIIDGNITEIINYYNDFLNDQEKSEELLREDASLSTFIHQLLINENINEPDFKQVLENIFKTNDSSISKRLFSLKDASGQNILALAAKRGFGEIIRIIIFKVANDYILQSEPEKFLEDLFYPDNNIDSSPLRLSQKEGYFAEMMALLKFGSGQLLSREHKAQFSMLKNDAFIHQSLATGWNINDTMRAIQETALPVNYWILLYSSAYKKSTDFFEKAKLLAILSTLVSPEDRTLLSKEIFSKIENLHDSKAILNQLQLLTSVLYQWELYLLSLNHYHPKTFLTMTYSILQPIAIFFAEESRPNLFLNLIFIALALGIVCYVASLPIMYGQSVVISAYESELNLKQGCESYGGFLKWYDWSTEDTFNTDCCNNDETCIADLNLLRTITEKLYSRSRGFKALGSLLLIFIPYIAALIFSLFKTITQILFELPYKKLESSVQNYMHTSLSKENMKRLQTDLAKFFQVLLDNKFVISGIEDLMTGDTLSSSRLFEVLGIAQRLLHKFQLETYTHPFAFNLLTILPPEQPIFKKTAVTSLIVNKWSSRGTNYRVRLEADLELGFSKQEDPDQPLLRNKPMAYGSIN